MSEGRQRGMAAAVSIGVTGLLLGGCTLPDGVDGDLVNGWGVMPEPVSFVPAVGVCHPQGYEEETTLADYSPLDCDRPHRTETVHVSEFTGEAADRVTPPAPASSSWREAYQECETGAAGYLGADFRHGTLWLGVTVPSVNAWEGGARWIRCDVVELEVDDRVGSLAGVLTGSSDLMRTCYEPVIDEETDRVQTMEPMPCSQAHSAEFVGVWHSPDTSYPTGSDASDRIHVGCREQVAEFADVPVDDDLAFRTGTIFEPPDLADWENGDRGFRCYLWLLYEVTESLAGAGTRGLPVQ